MTSNPQFRMQEDDVGLVIEVVATLIDDRILVVCNPTLTGVKRLF
ncbi:hypothetical protein [Natronosalvus halobius]|nr:hypothetical protein [Natronosalvus halobius]